MAALTSVIQTAAHHLGSFQENLTMLKALATRVGWIALSTLALLPALALDAVDAFASLFEKDISLPESRKLATWQKSFSTPNTEQIGALFARTFLLLPLFAVDLGVKAYEQILDWIQPSWEDHYVKSQEFLFFVEANRAAMRHQPARLRQEIEELLAGEGEMDKGDPPLNIYHYVATLTLLHLILSGKNAPKNLRKQIPTLRLLPDKREAITHAIYNFKIDDPIASQFFSIGHNLTQNGTFMRLILSRKKQG